MCSPFHAIIRYLQFRRIQHISFELPEGGIFYAFFWNQLVRRKKKSKEKHIGTQRETGRQDIDERKKARQPASN